MGIWIGSVLCTIALKVGVINMNIMNKRNLGQTVFNFVQCIYVVLNHAGFSVHLCATHTLGRDMLTFSLTPKKITLPFHPYTHPQEKARVWEYRYINMSSGVLLRLSSIDTFQCVWWPLNHRQYASLYLTLPGIVLLTFPLAPVQLHRTALHYLVGVGMWATRPLLQFPCPTYFTTIAPISYHLIYFPGHSRTLLLALCLLHIGVVTWLRKKLVLLSTSTPPQWADSGTSRK